MIPLKDENYILLIVKNLNKEITKKINCLVSLKGFKINQINQINKINQIVIITGN